MPEREPFRTEYIDKLYKAKNVKWLKKELEFIDRILKDYENELVNVINTSKEEKVKQAIFHEKAVRDKIEKYLKEILSSW